MIFLRDMSYYIDEEVTVEHHLYYLEDIYPIQPSGWDEGDDMFLEEMKEEMQAYGRLEFHNEAQLIAWAHEYQADMLVPIYKRLQEQGYHVDANDVPYTTLSQRPLKAPMRAQVAPYAAFNPQETGQFTASLIPWEPHEHPDLKPDANGHYCFLSLVFRMKHPSIEHELAGVFTVPCGDIAGIVRDVMPSLAHVAPRSLRA